MYEAKVIVKSGEVEQGFSSRECIESSPVEAVFLAGTTFSVLLNAIWLRTYHASELSYMLSHQK